MDSKKSQSVRQHNRLEGALNGSPEKPRRKKLANLTEAGNGRRLARRHGKELRHIFEWKKWLAWDGRRWVIDSGAEIQRRAKETVRSIYREAGGTTEDAARSELGRWAHESESARAINAMIALARSETGIPAKPSELDSDPWLLNCQNGTVDLRTGKLRAADQADLITKVAPVVFDEAAECPRWLAHLQRIFRGNNELIAYIQRLLGYCLTGIVRDHVLPIAYGTGRNGKGILKDAILGMLGTDYAGEAAPDLLMSKDKSRHPTEIADLFGKRFIVLSETDDGKELAEATVKRLTGGDPLKARRMDEDFWQFDPTHKVFMVTNHKPNIRGTDAAIWDRVKIIPFTVYIPEAERDLTLKEKLVAEYPGILNWCIRGCLEWQRLGGLNEPDEIKVQTNAYRKSEDVLGQFIESRCVLGAGYRAKQKALYEAYKEWSASEGHARPMTKTKFTRTLKERGCNEDDGRRWYEEIGLKLDDTSDCELTNDEIFSHEPAF